VSPASDKATNGTILERVVSRNALQIANLSGCWFTESPDKLGFVCPTSGIFAIMFFTLSLLNLSFLLLSQRRFSAILFITNIQDSNAWVTPRSHILNLGASIQYDTNFDLSFCLYSTL
jgi:hypothetical protein